MSTTAKRKRPPEAHIRRPFDPRVLRRARAIAHCFTVDATGNLAWTGESIDVQWTAPACTMRPALKHHHVKGGFRMRVHNRRTLGAAACAAGVALAAVLLAAPEHEAGPQQP